MTGDLLVKVRVMSEVKKATTSIGFMTTRELSGRTKWHRAHNAEYAAAVNMRALQELRLVRCRHIVSKCHYVKNLD